MKYYRLDFSNEKGEYNNANLCISWREVRKALRNMNKSCWTTVKVSRVFWQKGTSWESL